MWHSSWASWRDWRAAPSTAFSVAYVGLSSFVVTLGMMSFARSLAIVFSANQMLYKFGPDAPIVKAIGQAKWPRQHPGDWIPDWIPQLSSHFWDHDYPGAGCRLRVQLQGLGPPSLRHRRQRAGSATYGRSRRFHKVPGLCILRLHGFDCLVADPWLQRLCHQRLWVYPTSCGSSRRQPSAGTDLFGPSVTAYRRCRRVRPSGSHTQCPADGGY